MAKSVKFWSCCTFTLLVIIMAIVLLATSIHKLNATQEGLPYDTVKKELGEPRQQGLHMLVPFSKFIIFPAVYKQMELTLTIVTQDGLAVDISTNFQFMPKPAATKDIALKFSDEGKFEEVVKVAASAATHAACSEFNIADYQNGRPTIQARIEAVLQAYLNDVNASTLAVQLANVNAPQNWASAVSDKQRAQQDIFLAENERQQKLYAAQNEMLIALQTANITMQTAQANASVALYEGSQKAAAITAQYARFGDLAVKLAESSGVSLDGLVGLLSIQLYANNAVDLALDNPNKFASPMGTAA